MQVNREGIHQSSFAPWLGCLILASGLPFFAVPLIRFAWTTPEPINYGEGPILQQILSLLSGSTVYQNSWHDLPWRVANYPLGYHLVTAPLLAITGPSFIPLRVVSFLALVGCAFLLYSISRALGGSQGRSLFASLVFASSCPVLLWGVFGRVDMVALLFSLAALRCAIGKFYAEVQGRDVGAAILLGLLATFTRQTALALTLIGCAGILVLRGSPKSAVTFSTIFLGSLLTLFAAADSWTAGGVFLNLIVANANPLEWRRIVTLVELLMFQSPVHVILAFSAVALLGGAKPLHRVAPLLILASLPSALAFAKVGASSNYALELVASSSLVVVLLERLNLRTRAASILLIATLAAFPALYLARSPDFTMIFKVPDLDLRRKQELMCATKGLVLNVSSFGLELLCGKPLIYQPFEIQQLIEHKLWRPSQMIRAIRARRFELILVEDSREQIRLIAEPVGRARRALLTRYKRQLHDFGLVWVRR
jgi:hypothetical protein